MASPGQSSLFTVFSEAVTTAYRNHKSEITDNTTKHNALFRRLYSKGRKRIEDGGLSIVTPLDYQANNTVQRYSGYDTLNIGAVDVLTAAEYAWKQMAVHVAASGLELRQNSGSNRIINLIKAKLKNAQNSMANTLAVDLYSDGTLTNQIGGLQALIADAGTGTVGGINSSTYAFWQNVVQSAAAPLQGGGAITPSATTIESLMLPLYLRTTRNADMVDLIVFSEDYYTFFEQSQTSLKRYTNETSADAGLISLKYKTADVFFDTTGIIPAAHGYFVNTDYLEFVVHEDADMEMMDEKPSVNQDAVVHPIIWMGNLVASARFLHGVLKA